MKLRQTLKRKDGGHSVKHTSVEQAADQLNNEDSFGHFIIITSSLDCKVKASKKNTQVRFHQSDSSKLIDLWT